MTWVAARTRAKSQGNTTSIPCWRAAAAVVLYSSIAIVIGPTPPGTGVMASTVGFTGGELLRLLDGHPAFRIEQATSR